MKKYKSAIFVSMLATLLLVGGLKTVHVEAAKKAVESQDETTIPEHISISGVDVSGMTKEQAEAVVTDYIDKYDGVEFSLTVDDKSITADGEDIGLCAKNSDVVEQALSYGKKGNLIQRYKAGSDLKNGKEKEFNISLTADTPTVENFLKANKDGLVNEAVDNTVKLVNGQFEYVEGKPGVDLMVEKSAVAIADYISTDWDGKDATIELLVEKDEPRGTKKELSTIQDVLGTFNTNFGTAVDGRTKNINVASGKLDGTVVYPGEVVSVAEAIGPTTAENGYFPAGSYENGTTVETYGGGVCQVSTTLYNAVIRAELEVVTRAAHSMVVGYVEPSMDAAIADGAKDFQFKNNQKTPIYIESYTSGGNLYFTIYGKETRPANRKVEFVSEVTSQTDPQKEYVAVGDQPIGYVETTTKPHIGYTARLWKVVYEDGVEVSRDVFNNSKYNPSKEVISVGIASANPEAQAAVNAAIAAANEAQNGDALMGTVASWTDAAVAQRNADAAAQAAAANASDNDNNKKDESSDNKKEDNNKNNNKKSDGE
ncbi:MAG: VanW family protein [Lachnospiraceae bacterium]|nr:VanW family protein [Lachnospiraceae bacterium]MDD6191678.1 VanW family protein [Lachnospiraceae bacterium]MDY4792907.1 VanW family protein [Pararoseburia sp.]